jgi:hypothetical protein
MSIQATKREGFSDEKMVGIGEFEVLEFNRELDKDGKEIKYLGEKDGDTTFRIAITCKEVKTGKLFPLTFYLTDKEMVSKSGKHQFINAVGRTTYSDDIENLTEKFVAFPYHKARSGEAELVAFLDAWLDIDRKQSYDLTPNWKALMSGSVKELKDLQKTDLPRTITGMATVRVVEKDGELKEYQQIYSRNILPGYNMKFFRTTQFTPEKLEALREQDKMASETKKWLKSYEKFAVDVTDPEYGIKDSYYLGVLKLYNPDENIVAGDKVLSEEDANY